MIRLVAFDLDGTVANTLPLCIRSFQQAVSPYAGHALAQEEITSLFGKDETGMVKILAGQHWRQALEDLYGVYTALHGGYMPFEGIVPLIRMLKERGVITAMITGKGEKSCRISLEKFGMTELFSDVLTGSEHGDNKTQRLRELMDRHGVLPGECLYVGDTAADVRACSRAGVMCLSALWSETADRDGVTAVNPGRTFGSVAQLTAWLEQAFESEK